MVPAAILSSCSAFLPSLSIISYHIYSYTLYEAYITDFVYSSVLLPLCTRCLPDAHVYYYCCIILLRTRYNMYDMTAVKNTGYSSTAVYGCIQHTYSDVSSSTTSQKYPAERCAETTAPRKGGVLLLLLKTPYFVYIYGRVHIYIYIHTRIIYEVVHSGCCCGMTD